MLSAFEIDNFHIEILKYCYKKDKISCDDDLLKKHYKSVDLLIDNGYLKKLDFTYERGYMPVYNSVCITPKGNAIVEKVNIKELEISNQDEVLKLSRDANAIAENANHKSKIANWISLGSLIVAIVAIVITILC